MTDDRLDLDLDGDPYVDGYALLAAVASIVRDRATVHDLEAHAVDVARTRCRAAYERLGDALRVYRELGVALVDGAGTDGKYDLDECITAARLLLGLEVVDTPPL